MGLVSGGGPRLGGGWKKRADGAARRKPFLDCMEGYGRVKKQEPAASIVKKFAFEL